MKKEKKSKLIELQLDTRVDFGKHEGLTYKEMIDIEPLYFDWWFDKKDNKTTTVSMELYEYFRTKVPRPKAPKLL